MPYSIAFLKLTTLGSKYIPFPFKNMTEHYGLIITYKNGLYTHMFTTQMKTIIDGVEYQNKYIHIPNINGKLLKQYIIEKPFKINEKGFNLYQPTHAKQYLIDHMSKMKPVLDQLKKQYGDDYLITIAIDLTQYLP